MTKSRTQAIAPQHYETFGPLLKFLRRRAGLTQRQLALAVGYSESQISRLEKNERAPDEALLAARFVPALQLETEPGWAARLLELGDTSREPTEPATPLVSASHPHNLPLQLTSFIGREKELAEITQLLTGGTRLVTLVGLGGCGKTRLALQVGHALLPNFAQGVWLIELAPVTEPELVPQALAAVFNLHPEQGQAAQALLIEHLRQQHALLILDNCEHLIQASAQLAETLLQACPNLVILATSREMFGISGERPLPVRPLSIPQTYDDPALDELQSSEAVRLFVERAVTVAPTFALTAENAPAVTQICQRLDGIPLALELAAARLRILSVDQIAARLGDAFRVLTGGSRTALPRHQTLEALIDWSYDLLTEPERLLFQRLAVFVGGWTLEAAEAICSGEGLEAPDIFELLARLIDKSLVLVMPAQGEQPGRYRFLETIWQYTLAKLAASGSGEAVRQRHATYYLHLVESSKPQHIENPLHVAWLKRIEVEHGNLQAALTWSLATLNGPDAALADGLTGDVRSSAWAFNRLGWVARERGDLVAARSHLEQSLMVYRELADRAGIAGAAVTLGEVLTAQGETKLAGPILQEGLALAREQGLHHVTGWALNHLGHLAQLQGNFEQARQFLEESLAIFNAPKPHWQGLAWAHESLGEISLALENTALARQHLREAVKFFNFYKHEDLAGAAWCLAGMAGVAALDEEPERAAWLWGAAESIRDTAHTRKAPATEETHQRLMDLACGQIGEEAFWLVWQAGANEFKGLLAQKAAGNFAPLSQAISEAMERDS